MRRFAILAALAVSGCAQAPGVYVPASCVPNDYPHRPVFTDTDPALKAAPNFAGRYQLLAGNHAAHAARDEANEKIIDACR